MAGLAILVVVLIALEIWVDSNREWAKITGRLSLMPLNLGLVWFIGFPIATGLWTDISPPFDNFSQAAALTFVWLGPVWLFNRWHVRITDKKRDSDGRLRTREQSAAFRAREKDWNEIQWLKEAAATVRSDGHMENLSKEQAAGIIYVLKELHGVNAIATRSYTDHVQGNETAYRVRRETPDRSYENSQKKKSYNRTSTAQYLVYMTCVKCGPVSFPVDNCKDGKEAMRRAERSHDYMHTSVRSTRNFVTWADQVKAMSNQGESAETK